MHLVFSLFIVFNSHALRPSSDPNIEGVDPDPTGEHSQAVSDNLEYCRLTFTRCNNQIDSFCSQLCTKPQSGTNCFAGCQGDYGRLSVQQITSQCLRLVDDGKTASCSAPIDEDYKKPTPIPDPGPAVKPEPPIPRPEPVPGNTTKQNQKGNSTTKTASTQASSNCVAVYGTARSVCGQQGPSLPVNNSGGVSGACSQADTSGTQLASQWSSLVRQCSSQISRCYTACADSDYESSCQDLEGNLQYMISQQNAAENFATQASLGCERQAGQGTNGSGSTSPSSVGALSNSQYARTGNSSDFCVNPQNYSNPNCRSQNRDTSNASEFGNSGSHSSSANDFNVSSSPAANQADSSISQQTPGLNTKPVQPTSYPGAASSGSLQQTQARNNQESSNSKSKGSGPGHNTEVQSGERSGGGYQSNRNNRRVASVGGPEVFIAPSANSNGKDYRGIDLKEYLPGGKYYQGNYNYGPGSRNPQFHGPHEFLFEVHHRKYIAICQEGRLRGCPAAGDHPR